MRTRSPQRSTRDLTVGRSLIAVSVILAAAVAVLVAQVLVVVSTPAQVEEMRP